MAAPALSIVDFQNLLQPGQFGNLNLDIKTSLNNLTTTGMSGVTADKIKTLGPMILAVKTTASHPDLAAPPTPSGTPVDSTIGDVNTVLAKYNVESPIIKGYSQPTVALPTTSGATVLATTNSTYAPLIKYIFDTINDFGETVIPIVIQQNSQKKSSASVTALANMITAYVTYINSIVGIFLLNTSVIDPNYYKIIANIEKVLSKMNITIPAPGMVNTTELIRLVEPYTGPPVTAPLRSLPSGTMTLATSNGADTGSGFATHFPTPTQFISQAPLYDRRTGRPFNPPFAPRLPPPGAVVTGIEFLQPNTKVVSVRTNYPLPNSPTTMGYLITIDKPLVGWEREARGNVWHATFTYPPIASEDYEAQNYPAVLAAYTATARPTTDPIIVEIGKSITNSINSIVSKNTLSTFNTPKNIALIRTLPELIDTTVMYITSQMQYLNTLSVGNVIREQLAPIYPLSSATKKFFTELNSSNFLTNMTTPSTGILSVLVPNYTSNFSLNIIKKITNKFPTTGQPAILAGSVGTKLFKQHFAVLNAIIKIFNINLSADPPIKPLLDMIIKAFGTAPDTLITTPPTSGGKRRRITRKQKRKHRRYKKTKKYKKNKVT